MASLSWSCNSTSLLFFTPGITHWLTSLMFRSNRVLETTKQQRRTKKYICHSSHPNAPLLYILIVYIPGRTTGRIVMLSVMCGNLHCNKVGFSQIEDTSMLDHVLGSRKDSANLDREQHSHAPKPSTSLPNWANQSTRKTVNPGQLVT